MNWSFKKALSLITIFIITALIFIQDSNYSVKAADNLVGYWKFDEGSGSSPADSSGENVTGSFTATAPTWSTDVPSTITFSDPYSLNFTGTGDAVTIAWPAAQNFAQTDPRSFSFWYKPTGDGETASGNYDRIISWSSDGFEIAGTLGDVTVHRLAFYDGSWRDTGYDMTVGTWYNITFTYDGTNVKLYVNNVEKFSGASGGRALSGTMYIGTRYTGDEGINGRIDDVRVYDRALTSQEVQDISQGSSGPGVSNPTPTPSPTATPASTSSTSSSSTASNTPPSCTKPAPNTSPDLFQVSTALTRATVYFVPVTPANAYVVSYGSTIDANQYAVQFEHTDKSGVVAYTINQLAQSTHYYFKVRGVNECTYGQWSKVLDGITTSNLPRTSSTISFPTLKPSPTTVTLVPQLEATPLPQPSLLPSPSNAWTAEKDGYDVQIKILKDNQPIVGAVVNLHSEPQRTITDSEGIARFTGVERGKHTISLAYADYVGDQEVTLLGNNKLISLSISMEMKPKTFEPMIVGIAIGIGFILIIFLIIFIWKKRRHKD